MTKRDSEDKGEYIYSPALAALPSGAHPRLDRKFFTIKERWCSTGKDDALLTSCR